MPTQISESVRKFLEKPNFAVLVTRSNTEGLQATPVWFLYEGGEIIVNTSQGRVKLRNMRKHPDVVLTIMDRENPYQYVQIRGTVAGFDTRNGPRDIDRLSQRYVGKPYGYPGGDAPARRVTVRIVPARVSAQGS